MKLPIALQLRIILLPKKAYSKEQETEAHSEVVRAIRVLGISPEVYVTVLRKFGEHSEKNNEGKGGGLLTIIHQ